MRCPIVLSLVLALAACNAPAPTPSDESSAAPPPTDGGQTAEDRMPEAVLGTYDTGGEACAETTTMTRLVVSPDTLDFYYGYATVDAVDARDGGYDVAATLYQLEGAVEVVPEPTTYRIEPTDNGLRFESDYGGASSLVRCPADRVRRRDGVVDPGPSGSAGRAVQSRYTQIADCETVESSEESGGFVERCSGYRGTPLYVSRSDLRHDVDAGVRNDRWETPGGFNDLGETVEWRIRDGRPFAVIVRYEVEGPGGAAAERRSDLAVVKVGREGALGCLVGYVQADASPDQNTAARRLADRDAASFDCAP